MLSISKAGKEYYRNRRQIITIFSIGGIIGDLVIRTPLGISPVGALLLNSVFYFFIYVASSTYIGQIMIQRAN